MIGDSIMASTSRRYGGEMCQELVPRGWEVEMDAETGRFVDFGDRVLDSRLDAEWDVAVVMLGNNYGADKAVFEEYLTRSSTGWRRARRCCSRSPSSAPTVPTSTR